MHSAASHGQTTALRELLKDSRRNVNERDHGGHTPLYVACEYGHLDAVRMLVSEFGADVNVQECHRNAPLHIATTKGHVEIVRALVTEFGADVNAVDNFSRTPLILACSCGHIDAARVLLTECAADMSIGTLYGNTPLYEAVLMGNTKIIRILVKEFGVDVNEKNNNGYTPLRVIAGGSKVVAQTSAKKLQGTPKCRQVISKVMLSDLFRRDCQREQCDDRKNGVYSAFTLGIVRYPFEFMVVCRGMCHPAFIGWGVGFQRGKASCVVRRGPLAAQLRDFGIKVEAGSRLLRVNAQGVAATRPRTPRPRTQKGHQVLYQWVTTSAFFSCVAVRRAKTSAKGCR